jgi:hypothetical protein
MGAGLTDVLSLAGQLCLFCRRENAGRLTRTLAK